ncbi:hypothetical protein L873DRAFT_1819894 [Choiromyces venosus 120613-1]|uniref:Uncharacterized protein n=1 Tax=Choiromyces venosus 120613-1 TaxID=1336337 RepID=A0A3N4J3P9_9PEZI|nr:hypothetical protein L873DRAFT_1819894 [Choiromyces venosus 120613-1]
MQLRVHDHDRIIRASRLQENKRFLYFSGLLNILPLLNRTVAHNESLTFIRILILLFFFW